MAPSGSCATMVSHFYTVLFEDPMLAALRQRAEFLGTVTFELTEFLVDVLGVTDVGALRRALDLPRLLPPPARVGHRRQPRALLNQVHDAELVELSGAGLLRLRCGLFAVKNAAISTAMGERKVGNIARPAAPTWSRCAMGCMTHINGLLTRTGQPCRGVHRRSAQQPGPGGHAPETAPSTAAPAEADMPRRWQDLRRPRVDSTQQTQWLPHPSISTHRTKNASTWPWATSSRPTPSAAFTIKLSAARGWLSGRGGRPGIARPDADEGAQRQSARSC
ncbi:MAG: hypothetical protein R3A10_22815 [Caldilineaceae bacterium]